MNSLPLGSAMPAFSLPDVVTGKTVSSSEFQNSKIVMVAFICRHCPYVQHIKKPLAKLADDFAPKGVAVIGISSNDAAAYPDDAPSSLKQMAQEEGFHFPFLYDESQAVAKAYTAAATPDIFIFDQNRKLVYRGQFDDTRPRSGQESTAHDVREALQALLESRPLSAQQKPAMGCSIKWKPGNAPQRS